jgi:dihydrofolate reductase
VGARGKIADTEVSEMKDRTKENSVRKLIATELVSVDGVIGSPEEWASSYSNDEMEEANALGMAASDAMLLGRLTYEGLAAFWPNQPGGVPMVDYINSVRKFVVSTTLEEPLEWNNSTLIEGDLAEEVSRLKQQEGKDILVFGSGQLARTLMEQDLIDEYRLMVFPVVVGKGKRLFGDTQETKAMELVSTRPIGPDGVLILTYRPVSEETSS